MNGLRRYSVRMEGAKYGVSFGSALAIAISYNTNHSILWEIIDGLLSWLYVVSTQDLERREARFQLRFFTSGIVLLAAICIALYLAHTTLSFWHNEQNFGPFPNRNQTGDLFGATAIVILACAQDDLRARRLRVGRRSLSPGRSRRLAGPSRGCSASSAARAHRATWCAIALRR